MIETVPILHIRRDSIFLETENVCNIQDIITDFLESTWQSILIISFFWTYEISLLQKKAPA